MPIPDGGALGPRYRLVLPLSRPLEVSMVKPVALYVATMLGLAEVISAYEIIVLARRRK